MVNAGESNWFIVSIYEEANTLLAQSKENFDASEDYMYKGDIKKWRKLGNSIYLRLLMRAAQLYVRDIYATSSRPVKELKGFEKISLKAGESKTVSFEIGRKQLEYYNHALQLTVEPGDFEIMIGHDSQHVNKAKLTVN